MRSYCQSPTEGRQPHWRIPEDFEARAATYDEGLQAFQNVKYTSTLS
jgi:hypothetical protein